MYMKDVVWLTCFECDFDINFDAYFEFDSLCIYLIAGALFAHLKPIVKSGR